MPTAAAHRRLLLVLLLAAALYLVGNNLVDLWDRDEPRYAQTSKQMLLSNPPDWVVPRLLDNVRTAKPIFIYWCQAISMRFLGPTPFAARLPSAIAMLLTVAIVAVVIARSVGHRRALWTAFILATSVLAIAAAKMCITDGVLLLWITISQLCLYAIYHQKDVGAGSPRPPARVPWPRTRGHALPIVETAPGATGGSSTSALPITVLMWLAISLAILTKGPVVLGVQITTMLALLFLDVGKHWRNPRAWIAASQWWKHTRPLLGLLIIAAVVTPWLVLLQHRDPTFLRKAIFHDILERTVKPLEGHKGPPGFYLATILGTYFPWCLFLPTTFSLAWKNRRLAPLRFALAAVIGPWLMMEFVRTKLPHYVLPAFPPLAFLTADALVRCIRRSNNDLTRPAFIATAAVWSIIVALLSFAPWLAIGQFPNLPLVAMSLCTLAAITYAAAVFLFIKTNRLPQAALTMGLGMTVIITILYAGYLPRANFLWLPRQVAAILLTDGPAPKGDAVMIDFQEDSLPFYQGGTIRPRDDNYFTIQPPQTWAHHIVLTRQLWNRLPAAVTTRYTEIGSVNGIAYTKRFQRVDVMVLRKRE
jgi:4-amino-4-deoxy-L-arabinose transferase-like glycosyltransferase